MGSYTCQFGVVHSVCRCPTPHKIYCDVPEKHNPQTAATQEFIDKIDPSYYKTSVECIVITREMSYNLGNATKYLWRLGKKNSVVEELKKSRWYIKDEIARLEKSPGIPFFGNKTDWTSKFHLYLIELAGNERLVLWAICSAVTNSDVSQLERAVSMLDIMIAAEETKSL